MRKFLFQHPKVLANKSAGFTLLEIVVVITISSVLILGILTILDNHGRVFNFESGSIRTTAGTRTAMNQLQQYVLQASEVLASHTVNGTSYSTGTTTLVLEIPSVDSSNNVIASTWDYAAFYTSGSNLNLTIEPNGSSSRKAVTKRLSDSLSSISFTYDNADYTQVTRVDVDMTSQVLVRNQAVSSREQQQIYLRNH